MALSDSGISYDSKLTFNPLASSSTINSENDSVDTADDFAHSESEKYGAWPKRPHLTRHTRIRHFRATPKRYRKKLSGAQTSTNTSVSNDFESDADEPIPFMRYSEPNVAESNNVVSADMFSYAQQIELLVTLNNVSSFNAPTAMAGVGVYEHKVEMALETSKTPSQVTTMASSVPQAKAKVLETVHTANASFIIVSEICEQSFILRDDHIEVVGPASINLEVCNELPTSSTTGTLQTTTVSKETAGDETVKSVISSLAISTEIDEPDNFISSSIGAEAKYESNANDPLSEIESNITPYNVKLNQMTTNEQSLHASFSSLSAPCKDSKDIRDSNDDSQSKLPQLCTPAIDVETSLLTFTGRSKIEESKSNESSIADAMTQLNLNSVSENALRVTHSIAHNKDEYENTVELSSDKVPCSKLNTGSPTDGDKQLWGSLSKMPSCTKSEKEGKMLSTSNLETQSSKQENLQHHNTSDCEQKFLLPNPKKQQEGSQSATQMESETLGLKNGIEDTREPAPHENCVPIATPKSTSNRMSYENSSLNAEQSEINSLQVVQVNTSNQEIVMMVVQEDSPSLNDVRTKVTNTTQMNMSLLQANERGFSYSQESKETNRESAMSENRINTEEKPPVRIEIIQGCTSFCSKLKTRVSTAIPENIDKTMSKEERPITECHGANLSQAPQALGSSQRFVSETAQGQIEDSISLCSVQANGKEASQMHISQPLVGARKLSLAQEFDGENIEWATSEHLANTESIPSVASFGIMKQKEGFNPNSDLKSNVSETKLGMEPGSTAERLENASPGSTTSMQSECYAIGTQEPETCCLMNKTAENTEIVSVTSRSSKGSVEPDSLVAESHDKQLLAVTEFLPSSKVSNYSILVADKTVMEGKESLPAEGFESITASREIPEETQIGKNSIAKSKCSEGFELNKTQGRVTYESSAQRELSTNEKQRMAESKQNESEARRSVSYNIGLNVEVESPSVVSCLSENKSCASVLQGMALSEYCQHTEAINLTGQGADVSTGLTTMPDSSPLTSDKDNCSANELFEKTITETKLQEKSIQAVSDSEKPAKPIKEAKAPYGTVDHSTETMALHDTIDASTDTMALHKTIDVSVETEALVSATCHQGVQTTKDLLVKEDARP